MRCSFLEGEAEEERERAFLVFSHLSTPKLLNLFLSTLSTPNKQPTSPALATTTTRTTSSWPWLRKSTRKTAERKHRRESQRRRRRSSIRRRSVLLSPLLLLLLSPLLLSQKQQQQQRLRDSSNNNNSSSINSSRPSAPCRLPSSSSEDPRGDRSSSGSFPPLSRPEAPLSTSSPASASRGRCLSPRRPRLPPPPPPPPRLTLPRTPLPSPPPPRPLPS